MRVAGLPQALCCWLVVQGHLDTALRSSSAAAEDPDLLKRVDVRLQRTMDGDRGWDIFSLQYHIDGPMAAVFSQDNMTGGGGARGRGEAWQEGPPPINSKVIRSCNLKLELACWLLPCASCF